mmetsp:Transcript_21871/g.55137  ORF Transcript_21871/g.55137 Transcript_21871/m.55137 type:complete len:257 (+) Transcript_21871:443-1213(+)
MFTPKLAEVPRGGLWRAGGKQRGVHHTAEGGVACARAGRVAHRATLAAHRRAAEVDQLQALLRLRGDDILGLHVAVHNAGRVQFYEGFQQLAHCRPHHLRLAGTCRQRQLLRHCFQPAAPSLGQVRQGSAALVGKHQPEATGQAALVGLAALFGAHLAAANVLRAGARGALSGRLVDSKLRLQQLLRAHHTLVGALQHYTPPAPRARKNRAKAAPAQHAAPCLHLNVLRLQAAAAPQLCPPLGLGATVGPVVGKVT